MSNVQSTKSNELLVRTPDYQTRTLGSKLIGLSMVELVFYLSEVDKTSLKNSRGLSG